MADKADIVKQGEQWLPIKGYEGHYAVSNLGRVKSLERDLPHARLGKRHIQEKILKSNLTGEHGYLALFLHSGHGNQKIHRVHRLVAEHFIPNPDGKAFVNHIDGNRLNNRADNLEWTTPKENTDHAWRTGLCETVGQTLAKPVQNINTGEIFPSARAAALAYGRSGNAVCECLAGRAKTCAGYEWRYAYE